MAISLPKKPQVRSKRAIFDALSKLPFPLRQGVLGLGYAAVARRWAGFLPHAAILVRDLLKAWQPLLHDPAGALGVPDGLCGLAGRLDVPTLLGGYARGMFVHSHIGPLKWWAPRHRMVLFFDQLKMEKRVRRLIKDSAYRVTFETAFAEVMRASAEPRPGHTPLTWISPKMQRLFLAAHEAGHAHSAEVWHDDRLIAGVYGLAVGRVFFTESQFYRVDNTSKAAVAVLHRHLQSWGFAFNDSKHVTRYISDAGMVPIGRGEFNALVEIHARAPGKIGRWHTEPHLLDSEWRPADTPGTRMQDLLPNASSCKFTAADLLGPHRSNT